MILDKAWQMALIALAYFAFRGAALAQEAPTEGMAYNTVEVSAVHYECSHGQRGTLECEMLQTAVRKGKISQTSASDVKVDAADCAVFSELLEMLEGKRPAPKDNKLGSMTDVAKKDFIALTSAFVRICRDPSEENKLALINVMQDKERRTCVVTALRWHESFKNVSDGVWVTDGVPVGVCGVVLLNRFERDRSSGFTFWKYIARKAITNPEAEWEAGSGVKCKDAVDEGVYVYDWSPQEHQRSCDYFEFMSD